MENFENATLLDLESLKQGEPIRDSCSPRVYWTPLVGDPVYRKGLDHIKGSLVHDMSANLHAYALKLQRPRSGEWLEFICHFPGDDLKRY